MLEPQQIFVRANGVLISFESARQVVLPNTSPNDVVGVVNWELPPEGCFKLNVHVAVDAIWCLVLWALRCITMSDGDRSSQMGLRQ